MQQAVLDTTGKAQWEQYSDLRRSSGAEVCQSLRA